MGEKVGHHRTGSFPANMGPAAYNKGIFFFEEASRPRFLPPNTDAHDEC